MMGKSGMSVPQNLPPVIVARQGQPVLATMRTAADAAAKTFRSPAQLLLVVLPDKGEFWAEGAGPRAGSALALPPVCPCGEP